MGGKKGGQKIPVVDYFMSIHYGICHGPLDSINKIYVKEELLKTEPITAEGEVPLNLLEQFGGEKKEGGLSGVMDVYMGSLLQTMSETIASRFSRTAATMPAYRGIANVFFRGVGKGSTSSLFPSVKKRAEGFYWSSNNPYLPSTWINVTRISGGLNKVHSTIQYKENLPDANPSHMIYECITDTEWGMGYPKNMVDISSFEKAALTLFDEKFGLSMMWVNQSTIQSFIEEILDHVQGTLFVNPSTGLFQLTLIRDDYTEYLDDLPSLDENNSTVTKFSRKAWAETVNEIVVSWTNPENEQSESISYHDLANIGVQGGTISDTRNYYGVRNSDLAAQLAVRDSRLASAPLASAEIEVDRSAWDFLPGGVVKLRSVEDSVEQVVMRIIGINYGKPGDMKIRLNVMEDIFATEQAEWISPPVTEWIEPGQDPAPMKYVTIITPPRALFISADSEITDDLYPRVAAMVLAAQVGTDTSSFDLIGPSVLANGDSILESRGTFKTTSRGQTLIVLPKEAQTLITTANLGLFTGFEGAELGQYAQLGDDEATSELIMFDKYNSSTDTWTIARGILDTVPREHLEGQSVWYINGNSNSIDFSEVSVGETVSYQVQSRTSRGLLPLALAPVVSPTFTDRPYAPSRPAFVRVNNQLWSVIHTSPTTDVKVTWANRNRLNEDSIIKRWKESNVTPEEGQTTKIIIIDINEVEINSYPGIIGESFSIPLEGFSGHRFSKIIVKSERDGFESIQFAEIDMEIDLEGFGNNFDNDFG